MIHWIWLALLACVLIVGMITSFSIWLRDQQKLKSAEYWRDFWCEHGDDLFRSNIELRKQANAIQDKLDGTANWGFRQRDLAESYSAQNAKLQARVTELEAAIESAVGLIKEIFPSTADPATGLIPNG